MEIGYIEEWNNFKNSYLQDISLLLDNNRDKSAMLIMCTLIDSAASFYNGRDSEAGVSNNFRLFCESYMNDFCRVGFGDLYFSPSKKVKDVVDILYSCYRNGLIHEGQLPINIQLVRDSEAFYRINATGRMDLNIVLMFCYLKESLSNYESDLQKDNQLQIRFKNRSEYLKRIRFIKKQDQS